MHPHVQPHSLPTTSRARRGVLLPLALAALAAGCGEGAGTDPLARAALDGGAPLADALQRDLALATASALSADAGRAAPRARFASALEAGVPAAGSGRVDRRRDPDGATRPAPRRPARASAARARAAAGVTTVAMVSAPAGAPEADDAPAPVAEPVEPAVTPEPTVVAAPSPLPGRGPSVGDDPGEGRGRGGGGGWGGGVVIRGGGVGDDDHCERDWPRGRGAGWPGGIVGVLGPVVGLPVPGTGSDPRRGRGGMAGVGGRIAGGMIGGGGARMPRF